MFWGLPDPHPDLLVTSTDRIHLPQVRIRIIPFSHKSVERTEMMVAKQNFNAKIFLLKIKL
jgi:hypothetical protein